MCYARTVKCIIAMLWCLLSLRCHASLGQHIDCAKWNLVVNCSGSPHCNADFYFQHEASAVSQYLSSQTTAMPQSYQAQLTWLVSSGLAPVSIHYTATYVPNNPPAQRWLYDMLNWQQNPANVAAWNAYQDIDISQPPVVCDLKVQYAANK